jgi:inner membrane protein
MLFHTHILLGISFFLVWRQFFPGPHEFVFLSLVLLGSILPDIDSRHSKINRWSGIIGSIVTLCAKHRGIFHSLFFHVFLFFAVGFFTQYYATALFLGYLAHLLGDGVTLRGLRPFYPFSKFKIKGPLRVGSFTEGVIMLLLVLFIIKKII